MSDSGKAVTGEAYASKKRKCAVFKTPCIYGGLKVIMLEIKIYIKIRLEAKPQPFSSFPYDDYKIMT